MQRWHRGLNRAAAVGALALVGVASSCGYAKREEMQNELARLRQEMQAGDESLSQRIDEVDARVNALNQDLEALRNEFNVTVERLEGMLSFDVPVHFEFDRAEVRPQDEAVLEKFAAVVKQYYPNALVTVEGFTDPAGSQAYNLRLGKARAEAVKEFLTTRGGLSADQVRTVSYGEARDRQVAPGQQGPGEAGLLNRRVSLVVDYTGTAPRPAT
ncbi:MAG TPA: OmpA family protein [Longimicrobiales bacterium]